jgi:hypothetical protein
MFFPVWEAFPAWLSDLIELLWGFEFGVFFTSIPPMRNVDMLMLVYFRFMEITTARRPPGYSRRCSGKKLENPIEDHCYYSASTPNPHRCRNQSGLPMVTLFAVMATKYVTKL